MTRRRRGRAAVEIIVCLVATTAIALVGGSSASCTSGGCNVSQQNFQITPAESCVQPLPDVCDAASEWLHVHNGCADALTIDYGSTGQTVSLVSDATTATIAPGDTDQFNVRPFTSGSHVRITALLGSTAIVIEYDVVQN